MKEVVVTVGMLRTFLDKFKDECPVDIVIDDIVSGEVTEFYGKDIPTICIKGQEDLWHVVQKEKSP